MDAHSKELFDLAQPFCYGDLAADPVYAYCIDAILPLDSLISECFGGEVAQLWTEHSAAQFEAQRFHCLHYFQQGYLAAKAEAQKKAGA